ncbi:seipin [Petromyzon marinus]|uniref:seipin n=1 Tax=Petromyzon marinus TaxID=7757 RepID=UPI003F6EE915
MRGPRVPTAPPPPPRGRGGGGGGAGGGPLAAPSLSARPLLLLAAWGHEALVLGLVRARRSLLRAALAGSVLLLLLWVSLFLYGSFYYSYMPAVSFEAPAHYHFRSDCPRLGEELCSFPVANVSLTTNHGRDQAMMFGTPYHISLELVLPESPTNQRLGMFMVVMETYGRGGESLQTAERAVMLRYRSWLLRLMETVVNAPLLLGGWTEQKQTLDVNFYSDYRENAYRPTWGALVEIRARRVEIYSAIVRIHARFTGLRYLMYYFPVTCALVGVVSNFSFLLVAALLSYLQWGGGRPPDNIRVQVDFREGVTPITTSTPGTTLRQRRDALRQRRDELTAGQTLLTPAGTGRGGHGDGSGDSGGDGGDSGGGGDGGGGGGAVLETLGVHSSLPLVRVAVGTTEEATAVVATDDTEEGDAPLLATSDPEQGSLRQRHVTSLTHFPPSPSPPPSTMTPEHLTHGPVL